MIVETTIPGLVLRHAERSDAPTILAFIRSLARYERLEHEVMATAERIADTVFATPPAAEAVIAELHGKPAGFALFFPTYSTFLAAQGLYLEDLYVEPAQRGLGVGRTMLTYVASLAVRRGCGRFEWAALDWNTPAIEFYCSHGARAMKDWTVYRVAGAELERLAGECPASEPRNVLETRTDRYRRPAVVEPEAFLDYLDVTPSARRKAPGRGAVSGSVIVCYQDSLTRWVRTAWHCVPTGVPKLAACSRNEEGSFGLMAGMGIGGPAVVAHLEPAVAAGVTRIVSIGTAGAVSSSLSPGDVVVCEAALRDEGTSGHYLPPSARVEASGDVTDLVADALGRAGISPRRGLSWTTDAPFRETVDDVRTHERNGVLTVDMEAASVFAMAHYRSVQATAVFIVSDLVSGGVWSPRFHEPAVKEGLRTTFGAVASALAE